MPSSNAADGSPTCGRIERSVRTIERSDPESFVKAHVYAVAARNANDVVAAVNFARENRLRLVVKGGGYRFQGTSNAPDSLLIDACASRAPQMPENARKSRGLRLPRPIVAPRTAAFKRQYETTAPYCARSHLSRDVRSCAKQRVRPARYALRQPAIHARRPRCRGYARQGNIRPLRRKRAHTFR
jgi:hypothetical protein